MMQWDLRYYHFSLKRRCLNNGSSSVSIVDAYMETENILVLTMSNGQVFRIDLSEIPFEDVVEFVTKNGELFITLNDEIFEVKEEKEGE